MCNDNVTPRKTKNEFSYAQKVQERGLNHYPLRSSECFWEKRCPFLILRTRGNRQDEWTSDVDAMMMICTLLLMPIPPPLTAVFSRHILLHRKVRLCYEKMVKNSYWRWLFPSEFAMLLLQIPRRRGHMIAKCGQFFGTREKNCMLTRTHSSKMSSSSTYYIELANTFLTIAWCDTTLNE